MSEDEITKLKLMICHLDLSVETKEKLYNQAHKIRNQLQQKENIIKEVRKKTKENQEYLESAKEMYLEQDDELLKTHTVQLINNNLSQNDDILEILDKENKK